ncbi:MAG: hypothetical protein JNJ89_11750 [Rubrivivax sp.]|nr:hypothetical protein [Rubrivivax sp.]
MSHAPIVDIDPTDLRHDPVPVRAAMRRVRPIARCVLQLDTSRFTWRERIVDLDALSEVFGSHQPQSLKAAGTGRVTG